MPRKKKVITIVLVVALLLLMLAIYRSCRSGSVPPAERGALDETSYIAVHGPVPTAIHAARFTSAAAFVGDWCSHA